MTAEHSRTPPLLQGRLLDPGERLTVDVGRKLYVESIDNGRDYCQHMISISASAVPLYLALAEQRGISIDGVLGLAPPILFLLAVLAYARGFFSKRFEMNADALNDIDAVREGMMHHRYVNGSIGFGLFFAGVLAGIVAFAAGAGG